MQEIKLITIEQLKTYLSDEDNKTLEKLISKAEAAANVLFLKSEISRLEKALNELENDEKEETETAIGESNEFFMDNQENIRIGEYAKINIREVLESNVVPAIEIKLLQNKEYSKKIFDINFPLLSEKISDVNGYTRYYTEPINIQGKKLFICSQWQKGSFPYLKKWLNKYNGNLIEEKIIMTNAVQERKKFWEMYDKKLVENGNPLSLNYIKGNEITFHAAVNKKNSFVDLALNVEFLVRYQKLRMGIYICDNLNLYNHLLENKEKIEKELGFKCDWVHGDKNPNTRRVRVEFSFQLYNPSSYQRTIDISYDYLLKFKEVFEKYIPGLFDF